MKSFSLITTVQVAMASVLVGIIAGGVSVVNSEYQRYKLLPTVVRDANTNDCIKVVNYENGHVFNCNDVDLVLRQYRTITQGKE